ncbi:MAG: hypothetical protein ABR604_10070 [Jatrophihabitantaceae bacterium]
MSQAVRAAAAMFSAAALMLDAACSSSKPPPAMGGSTGAVPSASSSSAVVTCPPPGHGQAWPREAPAGLPVPPGLRIATIQRAPNVVIRFSVPDAFRATVRYLLAALPKAGFTLGTGDSEAEEADIPFGRGAVHASIKINDGGSCRTNGLLALGSG